MRDASAVDSGHYSMLYASAVDSVQTIPCDMLMLWRVWTLFHAICQCCGQCGHYSMRYANAVDSVDTIPCEKQIEFA